jgi:hypothetical protein
LHEDTLRLEQRLEELREKRNQAEQEAQNARSLHRDLEGPIKAAAVAVERLSAQISDVVQLVHGVKAGYPYFERLGFENAVDATGEVCTWTVLSEIPVPGTIFGHADADVRLPVEVQKLYAQARSTQLFERFDVCMCFEPPDDVDEAPPENAITHYLFGSIPSPKIENQGGAMFLIAQW